MLFLTLWVRYVLYIKLVKRIVVNILYSLFAAIILFLCLLISFFIIFGLHEKKTLIDSLSIDMSQYLCIFSCMYLFVLFIVYMKLTNTEVVNPIKDDLFSISKIIGLVICILFLQCTLLYVSTHNSYSIYWIFFFMLNHIFFLICIISNFLLLKKESILLIISKFYLMYKNGTLKKYIKSIIVPWFISWFLLLIITIFCRPDVNNVIDTYVYLVNVSPSICLIIGIFHSRFVKGVPLLQAVKESLGNIKNSLTSSRIIIGFILFYVIFNIKNYMCVMFIVFWGNKCIEICLPVFDFNSKSIQKFFLYNKHNIITRNFFNCRFSCFSECFLGFTKVIVKLNGSGNNINHTVMSIIPYEVNDTNVPYNVPYQHRLLPDPNNPAEGIPRIPGRNVPENYDDPDNIPDLPNNIQQAYEYGIREIFGNVPFNLNVYTNWLEQYMHIYSNIDDSPNKSRVISVQGPVTPKGGYFIMDKPLLYEVIVKYHETRDMPIGTTAYNQLLKWAALGSEGGMYQDISSRAKTILAQDPNISTRIHHLKYSPDPVVSGVARNHGARVLAEISVIREGISRELRNGLHRDLRGWTFNHSHLGPINAPLVGQIPENGVLAVPMGETLGPRPAPYAFARVDGLPDRFTPDQRVPISENNARYFSKYRFVSRYGERFWYQIWGQEIADTPFDLNNPQTGTFAHSLSFAMEDMIKCELFGTSSQTSRTWMHLLDQKVAEWYTAGIKARLGDNWINERVDPFRPTTVTVLALRHWYVGNTTIHHMHTL